MYVIRRNQDHKIEQTLECYEFTVLINIYHVLNLRVEHGGLYRDLHE